MNNNNFVLYLHVAPNGKKYFGITGMKPNKRWQNGYGYKHNNYFWRAIQKYSWNNIKHVILADDLTKEEACFFEQVMIALYDTTNPNNGYNQTTGGEHYKHSEETKQKISKANKGEKNYMYGKTHTEETKQRIREANLGKIVSEETKQKMRDNHADFSGENHPLYGKRGELCHWYGKCHTEETKQKMSESKMGIKHDRAKSVICLTTKQVFGSFREAERKTNVDNTSISRCCSGKSKSAGKLPDGTKLVWKYINHRHNNIYHITGGYLVDNEKMARLIEESFGQTLSDEEIALLIEDIFGTDESIDYDNLPDII